ncbi:MAG: hypothetical protein ACI9VR_004097 [Cognaticolwellia sp.]|jgi:hypothetical protein
MVASLAPESAEGAELVPIEIVWDGIGALHKSYFSEQEGVTALSVALAPYIQGTVQLRVSFNQEEHLGKIRIQLPPGSLINLVPASPAQLQQLSPITAALAVYRDHVSNRFDLRVQSFRIGLDFFRGPVHCGIRAGGDPPPDGRLVSPCVLVNGEEKCGRPTAQGVVFQADARTQIARCLQD